MPAGYDSKWEARLHGTILKGWEHHPEKQAYVIEHLYEPDFARYIGHDKILLETKGRFWDYAEFNKYIWIKKALMPSTELVFVFANPSAPMPRAKKRKNGTKRSHAEWAEANGFRWFTENNLPDEWIDK